jgi:hypothetical protein
MIGGGQKFLKPKKSKFKKNLDKDTLKEFRQKNRTHQDKVTYRLLKNEEKDDS